MKATAQQQHHNAITATTRQVAIATVRDRIKGLKGAIEDARDHASMHQSNVEYHQRELERTQANLALLTNELVNLKQWLLDQELNPED